MPKKKKYIPKYKEVKVAYEGRCPECKGELVFTEGSYYCPGCGFSEHDFSRVRKSKE